MCILHSNAKHKILMCAYCYFSKLLDYSLWKPCDALRLVASDVSDEETRKCIVGRGISKDRGSPVSYYLALCG